MSREVRDGDWTRGYSATYRVYEVDPSTWEDTGILSRVTSAKVERDGKGDAPTLESGSIELDATDGYDGEHYLRLAMDYEQDGATGRVDMCTLLCHATDGTVLRGIDRVSVTGASVLWPASRRRIERGTYAPRDTDGAARAAEMLESAIAAPVRVEGGGFTLDEHVVFEQGSSVLACAWQLLRAGGRVMTIDGRGVVTIRPMPTEPVLDLVGANARLLVPGVEHRLDMSAVPNRYVAVEDGAVAIATNRSASSPTSTVSRGYVADPEDGIDTSPVRVGGETLASYATRRLHEESVVHDSRTYTREWWPDAWPYCIVRGTRRAVGIDADMRIESQSISIGRGVTVTETAYREVDTWQA